MNKPTTIAIDLAKDSFQVCKLVGNNIAMERTFSRQAFIKWLNKQPKATVVMEACGSAHHWGRCCIHLGHKVKIIAPKHVSPFRSKQKTDKNDALAIAIASSQPRVYPIPVKSIDAQALQSIDRIRQHLNDSTVATSNMLRGLLAEFGIAIKPGIKNFQEAIPEILEDAENGLPDILRSHIHQSYRFYVRLRAEKQAVEKELVEAITHHPYCKNLMKLEGVGPINALGIFLAIGSGGGNFKNGRDASACIGLTPKQFSTGGVTKMLGISRAVANKRLRANLIQGALAASRVVQKREPRNGKEAWLKALIERAGLRKAAVALANKTIRTSWAMLKNGTTYQASPMMAN